MKLKSRLLAPCRAAGPESGQSLVEFALVLPLLLLLVFGIVDFARVYQYWNDQTSVANTGARYAAVGTNPGAPGTLADWIKSQTSSAELKNGTGTSQGVQGTGAAVCVSIPDARVGKPVTVVVTSQFGFIPFLNLGNASVKGSATSRLEAVPPAGIATTTAPCPT